MSSGKTYSFSGLRAEPWTNSMLPSRCGPRQLAEEIPAPLPQGRRAGPFSSWLRVQKIARSAPELKPSGIEQRPLVVVAQQAELALHDLVDHFAGVGPIADQVAETVDLGDALLANVGQHRFEALDVAVDIADEGSFHA